jgi:hypothetical protein
MTILVAISLVFAFLSIYYLFRMLHCIRHRRVIRAGSSCVSCLVFAAVAGAGGMLLLSYLT